ncbi:FtsX-like permease family protein [Rheinheimera sp. F8]|uniref:ABC transporter permease n=1 Tax=Rheinheimera sp. F8 TaxID=1763998 RepID=UPI00074487F8|nr:FtsX-like permease family protein [Rheinheimera sp. F8]ALZ74980.1 ABC transporter permease [Rheinheimera sp. F8]ALZ76594.1 ABC transporter permease [Rheinheimera sp. F8]
MLVKIAWRLFWRELRNGELWVVAFALMLAVLTVVSLSGITDSVRSALMQRSSNFTAADKVLRSSSPFQREIFNQAQALGLKTAEQIQFNTMVFAGDNMQLVNVKAVSAEYPLRGKLTLDTDNGQVSQLQQGMLYLEPRLAQILNVQTGATLDIGATTLTVGGLIVDEPDAPLNLFGGQPRVLMHLADVAATQVVQPGSRISYRYMFAGDETALSQLVDDTTPLLTANDRWQQLDRQSAVGSALDRAERFLLLAGLLGIVLAAAAAAVAANRYSQRHQMAVAVIKALGMTSAQARQIYFSHLLLVTCFASVLGLLLGVAANFAVQGLLSQWIDGYQAVFSAKALWLGIATALICSFMFSLRPVWRLTAVPAIQVLRQQSAPWQMDYWQLASGSAAVLLLMWLFSGDLWLSGMLFLACAGFGLCLLGFAALLVRFAKPMAAGQSSALKLALANLRRRLWQNSFQLMTFSLALFLTLVLYFLRAELLEQWKQQVPENAPNQFLVNMTAVEKDQIAVQLHAAGLSTGTFYPMVSGRVLAVNGETLEEPEQDAAEQASSKAEDPQQASGKKPEQKARREGFGRELNLSWLEVLPANNQLTEGRWFSGKAEVSVEQQQAQRLQLKLGDTLSFAIGGQQFDATVTSFRKVDWNSLQPNFFMLLSPDLMAAFPATYLTAFYLPASKQQVLTTLLKQYPTVSVISVDAILLQVSQIIDQVSLALTLILILVFTAAVLVLVAQVQATVEQREQELAILRTLGARGRFLQQAVLFEFAALGLLAGGFATLLAEILLSVVQLRMFQLPFTPHYSLWGLGPVAGVLLLTGLGTILLRGILKPTPASLIRRALHN